MSLRVWLPFTSDLSNNGFDDITITNSGATVDNSGKLGKCYNFTGTYIEIKNPLPNPCSSFSICGWVKLLSGYTANYGLHIVSWQETYNRICISKDGYAVRLLLHSGSTNYLNGSNATASSITADVWNHYAITYGNGIIKIYINGQLDNTLTALSSITLTNVIRVGTFNSESSKGCVNDLRIYDHCISAKEVSEIAKGLVVHYPLNDPNVTDNLILNGFGQDGLLGWSNSSYSTTEIPSVQPTIKASYTNNNQTTDYIPISHGTTYTISEYIKATSGATGNTYPSLLPYDVDKLFIENFMCLDGFNSTYKTTLSQPLKKGDTVVHATDLSAWTTATTNHYYYVAVFGYKDSTGYVYPDMTYTHDSLRFGTQTDKSNIDKTNNTITLSSAYQGEDRPAGTTICQATAGSAYVYPYGGIAVSTISDWTFKTATVNPSGHNRLKWARYVRYLAYPNAYHAGIKLVDNNADKIVYDSSGYCNSGKATGTFPSADTARNLVATRFVVNADTVKIAPCYSTGQTVDKMSVSIWFKTNTLNSTAPNLWSLGANSFVRIRLASATSIWFYIAGTGGTYTTKTLTDDVWHNVVYVFNSGIVTMYLDGSQIGTTDVSASKPVMTVNSLEWYLAGYNATQESFIGNLSDFRIYATTLTAEDALQLYNTPVSIANNGSMLTQGEFVEI